MKRLTSTLLTATLILGSATASFSQKAQLNSAIKYLKDKDLDKAKTAIDAATIHEDTKEDPKTWYYRGAVYGQLAYRDNQIEEKLELSQANMLKSVEAYKYVVEIDKKNKFSPEAQDSLFRVATYAHDNGIKQFNGKNFKMAKNEFTMFVLSSRSLGKKGPGLNSLLVKNLKYDTTYIKVILGQACDSLGQGDEAMRWFQDAVNSRSPYTAAPYVALAKKLSKAKNDAQALATYDIGIEVLQKSENKELVKIVLVEKLNYLLEQNKPNDAINAGLDAIKLFPTNVQIYLVVGDNYMKVGKMKEAMEMFAKAKELEPNSFTTNYLIGIHLFNSGVDIYNKSIKEPSPTRANELIEEAKSVWKQAIPALENAEKNWVEGKNPKGLLRETYKTLKLMYGRIENTEKFMEYKGKETSVVE